MTRGTEPSLIAEEVRQYDYDRWLCSLFAPFEIREHLFAFLAFNIELSRIRETVSEPMLGDIRLQWWREALSGLERRSPKSHPVIEALDFANRQKPIDFSLMQSMVDVRAKDLDPTPISSIDELMAYADGTGGSLHRLMASLLELESSEGLDAAGQAGRAFALAGIVRAIPFHFRHDLVLIPIELMEEVSVTRNTVFQEEHRKSFFRIVERMTERAGMELQKARKQARAAGPAVKPVSLINGITGLYLRRLKAAAYDPAHRKLQAGRLAKIASLFVANLSGR
mgnify:CR=1 FL=1